MLCRNPRAPEIYYTALYEFPNRPESRADYTSLPRPTHNVAIVLRGRGIITQGESTVEVQPGEILFIPKHARYKSIWIGDPDIRFQTVHFDYTWQNDPLRGKRIPIQKLPLAVTEDILADYDFLLKHQNDTGADAFAGVSVLLMASDQPALSSATVSCDASGLNSISTPHWLLMWSMLSQYPTASPAR